MRDAFLDKLYDIAREDRRVILISNDFGAPSLDKFREDLPDQFVHIGIAEQNMVDVATGLALAGNIVYMYSIGPFLPLRCYEQLRVHLAFKRYNITGVMVGAGYSYDLSGPSHHALEDIAVMNVLPDITILNASDSIMGAAFARMSYEEEGPKYIRFDREVFSPIYDQQDSDFSDGLTVLKDGSDLFIIASGIMVHQAFTVVEELARNSIDAGIIDLYRIKPLNKELLLNTMLKTNCIVTMEENFLNGGIGSIIANLIVDCSQNIKLRRLGIPEQYFSQGGGREVLHRLAGLDVASITENILKWAKENDRKL